MAEHPHSDFRIDMAQFAGYCLPHNERVFCLCVCHDTGERRSSHYLNSSIKHIGSLAPRFYHTADLQTVDQFVSCFHRHLLVILDNALYEQRGLSSLLYTRGRCAGRVCTLNDAMNKIGFIFFGALEAEDFDVPQPTLVLFIFYNVIVIILLLNIIIAVMSDSYTEVNQGAELIFWNHRFLSYSRC